MNAKQAQIMVAQLPNVSMKDHFGSNAYSANERMFITIWADENKANVRLSPRSQREFLSIDGDAFAQINNAWGRQGWTTIRLEFVESQDFSAALKAAYEHSTVPTKKAPKSPKKIASKLKKKKK